MALGILLHKIWKSIWMIIQIYQKLYLKHKIRLVSDLQLNFTLLYKSLSYHHHFLYCLLVAKSA